MFNPSYFKHFSFKFERSKINREKHGIDNIIGILKYRLKMQMDGWQFG